VQDQDWEVKLRGLQFLHHLLNIAMDGTFSSPAKQEDTKRQRVGKDTNVSRWPSTALALFLDLDGDRTLIEFLQDYERLVRLKAACLLESAIISWGEKIGTCSETYERMAAFWRSAGAIDLAAMQRDAMPKREEEEDDFLTRHITAPPGIESLSEEEQPFLDCPFWVAPDHSFMVSYYYYASMPSEFVVVVVGSTAGVFQKENRISFYFLTRAKRLARLDAWRTSTTVTHLFSFGLKKHTGSELVVRRRQLAVRGR